MRHDVEIEVTEDGATLVVALAGEVDLRSAGRLGVALNAVLRRGGGPSSSTSARCASSTPPASRCS